MENRRKYLTFIIIVTIGVALDQITKVYAVRNFKGQPVYDGDAFFSWAYAENDGAFLSLGSTWPDEWRLILLTLVPALLLLAVMVYMLRARSTRFLEVMVFSLIAAGGIGNLIDRILEGKVVDFMHMNYGFAQTGIFNVADLYITFGIIIYVLGYFFVIRHREELGEEKDKMAPQVDDHDQ
ncbi:MAG: signal peptidase II [Bacteroidota bacterium]